MKRCLILWLLLSAGVFAPAAGAWEYDPLAKPSGDNHLSATLTLLRSTWGELGSCEGELMTLGSGSLSLSTYDGRLEDHRVLAEAAAYLNGYSSSPGVLSVLRDPPLYVRCYTEKRGRVVLIDAISNGFECAWIAGSHCRATVRCGDGAELTLEVWPSAAGRQLGTGEWVYVMLDFQGRIRRIVRE